MPESSTADSPPSKPSRKIIFLGGTIGLIVIGGLVAVFWANAAKIAIHWRLARAHDLLLARKNVEALTELRIALRRDLWHPETHLLLARTHRRLGNLTRASTLLAHAAERGADVGRIEREKQLIQAQAGNLKLVEPHLADLLVHAGDDGPDICQAFVQGFFSNARTKDAMDLLDVWELSYPKDAEPVFMRAYLKQGLSHFPEAIALYRRGLAMDPDRTTMRRRLAETLVATQGFDTAESELAICFAQAPNDAETYHIAAQCAREQGKNELAAERVSRSLTLDPNHLDARRLKGQIDLESGKLEEAASELNQVVLKRPYDNLARDALGKALRALGKSDEAKVHFDYVSSAESNLREAERLVRESLQQPSDADLRYRIGSLLMQYGPPEDGAKWLKSAIELQPNHAGAHEALAAYLETKGESALALFHRQQAHANRQP